MSALRQGFGVNITHRGELILGGKEEEIGESQKDTYQVTYLKVLSTPKRRR